MRGALWRGVADATFLHAHVPTQARVLELGCGDGKFLAGLAAAGYHPFGVDFARSGLQLARERARLPLVLGDVRALPFTDQAVAAVAARYVLGALVAEDRRRAGAELARVLQPGGTALVEEFATGDFRHGTGRQVEPETFERNRGLLTHYFQADEGPALVPDLDLVQCELREGRQRVREGLRPRRSWRWILRKPS
jgi:ubiquinone/menaquinone biosynthesis C-methylase UbiE